MYVSPIAPATGRPSYSQHEQRTSGNALLPVGVTRRPPPGQTRGRRRRRGEASGAVSAGTGRPPSPLADLAEQVIVRWAREALPGRPRPRTSRDLSSGRQRAGTWRGAAGRSCPQPEPWGPVARGNCAPATSCTPAQWPRPRRAPPRPPARHPPAAQCRAWSSAANLVVDAVAEHVADATAGVVGIGVAVDDRRDLGGVPRGRRRP